MIHKVLTIQNPEGLRARPAAQFVQLASGFSSQMLIEKGNKKVNAKSIMGVLSLGVGQGIPSICSSTGRMRTSQ